MAERPCCERSEPGALDVRTRRVWGADPIKMPAEKRKPAKKDPEGLRSFEYHCADSYWSYRRTAERIFGTEGTAASERVLLQVGETYGKEAAERLLQYRDTDFASCDSREL